MSKTQAVSSPGQSQLDLPQSETHVKRIEWPETATLTDMIEVAEPFVIADRC